MTHCTSPVIFPLLISKLQSHLLIKYRYCGGNTQANNFTSLASLDYSFVSQFGSNGVTYLATEWGNIQKKIANAKYETELPHKYLLDCLQRGGQGTQFCDGFDCPQGCPSQEDVEKQLNAIVSNRWETGQVWGDFFANMFQGSIDAPQ